METTSNEKVIAEQIATNGGTDERNTGILKAEQPILEEIPDTAVVVREYAKWTDGSGQFHKVPIDGTTAIRGPAHEQQELTVEDRDRLDQTLALRTPRRNDTKAEKINDMRVHNDEVHASIANKGVESAGKESGPVTDGKEFQNSDREVKIGTSV